MRTRSITTSPGRRVSVLVAVMLLAPGTAVAAGTNPGPPYLHFSGDYAVAAWSLGDSRSTSVMIVAADSRNQTVHGPAETFEGVTVDISQSYCDTTSTEYVSTTRHGEAQTPVFVDKKFALANWATTDVTMSGTEYRWSGCGEEIDWENPISVTPMATYDVRVAGELVATAELSRDNYTERYVLDDGVRVVVVSVATGRSATAEVDMSTDEAGLLSLLPLGEPDFGVIGSNTRIEAFVRTCGSSAGSWPFCSTPTP